MDTGAAYSGVASVLAITCVGILAGFTQVREKSGKIVFPQGQGKVSEF